MKKTFGILIVFSLLLWACGEDKGNNPSTQSSCSAPTECTLNSGENVRLACVEYSGDLAQGTTVTLHWIGNVADCTGWNPEVSLDGGTSFSVLSKGSITTNDLSKDTQCFEFEYTVPSDKSWLVNGKANDQVIFRIQDYTNKTSSWRSDSDTLTVIP